MKEHIKPIQTEDKNPSGKRIVSHVVFLALPVLCILFVSFWGFTGYLCGRLSLHLPCMLYPLAVILMIFCFLASIARLIYAWRKCMWARRTLIIIEICLPILFVALFIMPIRRRVESQLWPDAAAFTYGLRDRVRNKADIPAIQNWLKTLDKKDYTPRRDYLSADELPEPLKAMCFGVVSLSEDKNGNPKVNISAGGGFHHWGAIIGMEDMEMPPSWLDGRFDSWLLVEPGVYVGEW